jgi:molybdopterin/thiamine biosynthesis adenylyltransferase
MTSNANYKPAVPSAGDAPLARYSRQMVFEPLGEAAQRRLLAARVTLIGCGGLGTVLADMLVRAGLGFLRVVDRDYVELSNLQRQVLFTERDAAEGLPKAVAAAQRLAEINSTVTVEPVVADATADNVPSLADGAHLLLDGTDNFETRFLINDAAVKRRIPWVYGACIAAEGMVLPILPGTTPCLRCIWEHAPPPGLSPTCETAGILAPIVHIVAALQVVAALQILTGRLDALNRRLVRIDAWTGEVRHIDVQRAYDEGDCPCCQRGVYEYLSARSTGRTAVLCGRQAVQITPPAGAAVDFDALAARLAPLLRQPPTINRYLMRFAVERFAVTLFRDGRAIIQGTTAPDEARTVYAKYVGS